jgi:drug/metabolite transporter (DMT)-like permease
LALTVLAASRVAAFSYLQPFFATSLGIWLLAERLTPRLLAGGALILLGVYLTERERGEDKEVSSAAERAA